MTEKDIRKRLDEVTKQLDEERAKNAKLTEVVADLAKAAAAGELPVGQPWIQTIPMPQRPWNPPYEVVMYMAQTFDPPFAGTTITYKSTIPGGDGNKS